MVVVGVVYNPVLEELFVAATGGGAYLNGERLTASSQTQLAGAVLGTEVSVYGSERWYGAREVRRNEKHKAINGAGTHRSAPGPVAVTGRWRAVHRHAAYARASFPSPLLLMPS